MEDIYGNDQRIIGIVESFCNGLPTYLIIMPNVGMRIRVIGLRKEGDSVCSLQ